MENRTDGLVVQVAHATLEILSDLDEVDSSSKPLELLESLVSLTKERISQRLDVDKIGFTFDDLAKQMIRPQDKEHSRRYVNRHLKELNKLLSQYEAKITRELQKRSYREYLAIAEVTESKRKYLHLDTKPIGSPTKSQPIQDSDKAIEYHIYSAPKPNRLVSRIGVLALSKSKGALWSLPLFGLSISLLTFLASLFPGFMLWGPGLPLIFSAVFAITSWLVNPIYLAVERGISIAPTWLSESFVRTSFFTLEPLDSLSSQKVLRIKTFEANCPICNGSVFIQKGKRHLKGRFVGQCQYSPEHLYTFDHMTLSGRYALQP
ncbi:hypothetical protein BGP77_16620 [Saccharospirillum sp. MSK14-1]|uniref:hypothetical protein n=1 Tax=Saccharospirillum sp. MSK14-1 TaxID=1897632 RepID=UPI000D3712FC|nr:hypothetical protein [Saccharospirillum sp. MSK14-1]PTY38075.1 hypothetical protein BGP77_16620 [Saccharospirillum sp. MSK14-1]